MNCICRGVSEPYCLTVYNCAGGLPLATICLPIYHYWESCHCMILHQCNRGFPRSHIRCPQGISNTSGASASSSNSLSLKHQGHNDVNGWAPPSHPCFSVMMTPLFMRFKSIKSDEAMEKEGAHKAAWLPHRFIWTHPFQMSHFFPWTFTGTSTEGVRAGAYCFWLVPAEHLLMSNEKQRCNASETVREQMHWIKSTAASHDD